MSPRAPRSRCKIAAAMKLLIDRLIWITGMVGIVWVMPLRFENIAHPAQERIIGFCGQDIVSTSKGHIIVRSVETLETRKIDYPDAALLYTASKPPAGSCQLIPDKRWLCAMATPKEGSRIDVVDLSAGRIIKRCQLPTRAQQWIVARDGSTLIYATGHGELRGVDIASDKPLWEYRQKGSWRISPDGRFLAVSGNRDILECRSGRTICRLFGE